MPPTVTRVEKKKKKREIGGMKVLFRYWKEFQDHPALNAEITRFENGKRQRTKKSKNNVR